MTHRGSLGMTGQCYLCPSPRELTGSLHQKVPAGDSVTAAAPQPPCQENEPNRSRRLVILKTEIWHPAAELGAYCSCSCCRNVPTNDEKTSMETDSCRQNVGPQEVPVLIPGNCKHATSHGKREWT